MKKFLSFFPIILILLIAHNYLKADKLFTWGNNSYGQLGTSNQINYSSPVQVGTASNWVKVSGGQNNSTAIQNNSTQWIWGNNSYGRHYSISTGTATHWRHCPVAGHRSLVPSCRRDWPLHPPLGYH